MTPAEKAIALRLLLFDVDGVLTDGTVVVHGDETEAKLFSIRDGTGIVYAHKAGLLTGLLSSRPSSATTTRAAQLSIAIVEQASLDKLGVYQRLLAERGLRDEQVSYMGDDLLDLPVLRRAGLSACPADAVSEVRARVDWVGSFGGGRGAVREFIEFVLRAKGLWDDVVQRHLEGTIR
jgi:3-deoxy-D-manno-octulosonate 8-phosphate phosphatase (KDO 8-P phosphatase)